MMSDTLCHSFSLSLSHFLCPRLSFGLSESVQRHQSVCGGRAVGARERAAAHRRPGGSRGEEAALSHGHRYPEPNYAGEKKKMFCQIEHTHTRAHTYSKRVGSLRERESFKPPPTPAPFPVREGCGGDLSGLG